MKNPSACWLLFAIALGPLLGCGGTVGVEPDHGGVGPEWERDDRPPAQITTADPQESWKIFCSKVKSATRLQLADSAWKVSHETGKVQIKFLKQEMEYVSFDKAVFPGIEPNKTYEVGVMTLAAKETAGATGNEVREYVLRFVRKGGPEEWSFIGGTFVVSSREGSQSNHPLSEMQTLHVEDYKHHYLSSLFNTPPPQPGETKAAGGKDQAVETQAPAG